MSDVEREGVPSLGWNGCTVDREKIVAGALFAPWDELRGNTQFGTGVNQESQVVDSVGDE
jgi:hypothetical protein